MHRSLVIATALVAGVLASGVLTLALFDWNAARPWISAQVQARTGRLLAIEGNLRVRPFSLNPRIFAERVTLGNADWGEPTPMVAAEEVEFSISLPALARGRLVFPDVRLKAPAVLLQRDRSGRRNWILDPSVQATAASPAITNLEVDDGQLEFRDAMSDTDLRIHLNTTAGQKYGIAFSAAGRAVGRSLAVNGAGGRLLTLLDEHTPYPLQLKSTIGATSIDLEGVVYGVATLSAVDARFTIAGKSLATLSDLLHIVLPATAPYRFTGHLERRESVWHFGRFRGIVGRSDLGGDFSLDMRSARPMLRGNLRSSLLDIADLGGFVGADPGSSAPSTARRVLPRTRFDLEKLRRADADVNFVATRFTNRDTLPLDDLKAHLVLQDGVLQMVPVNFGVAGGNMRSTIWFDARSSRINARIDTQFQRLHINRLVPRAGILESALGTIDGNARLAGSGNSTAAMLGVADGRLALVSAGGNISSLLVALAGANGAKILQLLVLGDREVKLHCGAAAFNVQQGVMTSDVLVVDTGDTNISGGGNVNLRDETIDLTLNPLPKKPSVLSLRGPLHITGTFAEQPRIGFDVPTVSMRAGGAVLLGIVNPLAALLPLIETGPGKDSDCARLAVSLTARARQAGDSAPRS